MSVRRNSLILLVTLGLSMSVWIESLQANPVKEPAQPVPDFQPVAAFAFSNFHLFRDRVGYLVELSGQAGFVERFEGLISGLSVRGGIVGIDTNRPLGLIVLSNGLEVKPLIFLGVKNKTQLLQVAANFFPEKRKLKDGFYHLSGTESMYLHVVGAWGYLSPALEPLQGVLVDPPTLIGIDAGAHDFSVSLNMSDLPESYVDAMKAQVQADILQNAVRMPGESNAKFIGRMHSSQLLGSLSNRFLKDGQRVSLGLSLSRETKNLTLDLSLIAKNGSQLSRTLGALLGGKSQFSDLHTANSVFSLALTFPLESLMRKAITSVFGILKEKLRTMHQVTVEKKLDKRDKLTMSWRNISKLLKAIEESIAAGRIDLALSLRQESPTDYNLIVASLLTNTKEVEAWLVENLPLYDELDIVEKFKLNAENHGGVQIHTVWPRISDPSLSGFFGGQPTLHLGFGKNSFYLAIGKNSLRSLKSVIDDSLSSSGKNAPLDFRMSGSSILKMLNGSSEAGPLLKTAKNFLSDQSRVQVALKPITNGVQLHCEFEEGFIRWMSQLAVR